MRVLGLATRVEKKRATVHAVVLDDGLDDTNRFDLDEVCVVEEFDIPVDEDELAAQLGDAGANIAGRSGSLSPDRVIIRRADRPARPSNMEGPRVRLLVDGALTASAQRVVPDTVLRAGKECGAAYGVSKDELDEIAGSIVAARRKEAAAAALSGLAEGRLPD